MKLATFYTEFSKRKIDMCGGDFFFSYEISSVEIKKFEEKSFRTRIKKIENVKKVRGFSKIIQKNQYYNPFKLAHIWKPNSYTAHSSSNSNLNCISLL